jgi:small conductance mechanosensitive channel
MDITQIPEIILGKLENWLTSFISTLPNLVVAILILAAGIFLAKFISKGIQKLLRKFLDNEAMIRLSGKLAVVAMILGAGFLALGVLNLDKTVTSLLAGAGIAGLAISLAFKDAAMNLIAGVYIAVRKPFEPGSHIDTNDWEGIVKHISLRSTQIRT